ncbi:hypothetical protein V6N13_097479 [Hibiscus sabdariffa]
MKQAGRSVYEYECEFNKLSRFATEFLPTEKDRTTRFVGGLDHKYKKVSVALDLSVFQEAINRAKGMERVEQERSAGSMSSVKKGAIAVKSKQSQTTTVGTRGVAS